MCRVVGGGRAGAVWRERQEEEADSVAQQWNCLMGRCTWAGWKSGAIHVRRHNAHREGDLSNMLRWCGVMKGENRCLACMLHRGSVCVLT